MARNIVKVFKALETTPIVAMEIFQLLAFLQREDAHGYVCHKHDKNNTYSTTWYDTQRKVLYRARHDFGVLVMLKRLARGNSKLLVVKSTDQLRFA